MELREIEYFIAIAYYGLSGAAKKLYISQPALSQFLLKLEKQIGAPLFFRNSNNSLSLTKAGEIYLESANKIWQIKEETSRSIEQTINTENNSISIGVTGNRTLQFASNLLAQLHSQFPEPSIHILDESAAEITSQLKQRKLDFGLLSPIEDPDLEFVSLSCEEVLLIIPRNHELAHLGNPDPHGELNRINIHSLKSSKFVLIKAGTVLRSLCEQYFSQKAFQPIIYAEGFNNLSAMNLVEDGEAISLTTAYYGKQLKNVCFAALDDPFYYSDVLAYRKDANFSEIKEAFLKLVMENISVY